MQKKKLWQRLLLTILVLILYRLCFLIPTPGVDRTFFKVFLQENTAFDFLNSLTGNGFGSMSIMVLGITPYINATIILQLLGAVFQPIQDLQQGMGEERKLFDRLTLFLSGVMAVFEALMIAVNFGKHSMLNDYKWYWILLVTVIWTGASLAVSAFGMYMGKRKDLFIGNGVSVLIGVNIISSYPTSLAALYNRFFLNRAVEKQIIRAAILVVLLFLLFSIVFYFQETQKEIPILYTGKMAGKRNAVFPIRLSPGGVMPVIFASTIISIPVMVTGFMEKEYEWVSYLNTSKWFLPDEPKYTLGVLFYVAMLFLFSYFYMDIACNPNELVNNLRKKGGMIEHVGSGDEAIHYLSHELHKTTTLGSIFMAFIVMIPFVISGLFNISHLAFLGTSILISISVFYEMGKDVSISYKAEKYEKGELL